ncbi:MULTISPECIES: helix-turn-helix domain-containing protein [unclassified Pseudodesulfovibrio]|uniref:helix-turn-helix domain-containing protein n=1 Tax=unclassified Pseudodesulfovibrio TaxID=2661612 RepID=UPI000FEBDD59|nr:MULTISPECIES: helix-turn-helix domain-containing protein [unclassified Pseudodesulfovibrio]MCJ2164880.1 helix-turn-helix domain containing protein [Pseudodesulfovibrio sp. S3-i]RWU03752.1 hypothetical protein DWB63_09850 [Pseudodesulfovibrio sp. S3]
MVADCYEEETALALRLGRMIQAVGVRSEAALARELGISHQAIYNAKKRGNIPLAWIKQIAEKTGRSVEWLLNEKQGVLQDSGFSGSLEKKRTGVVCFGDVQGMQNKINELYEENRSLLKENAELKILVTEQKVELEALRMRDRPEMEMGPRDFEGAHDK